MPLMKKKSRQFQRLESRQEPVPLLRAAKTKQFDHVVEMLQNDTDDIKEWLSVAATVDISNMSQGETQLHKIMCCK